jgi:hypothetical protein
LVTSSTLWDTAQCFEKRISVLGLYFDRETRGDMFLRNVG